MHFAPVYGVNRSKPRRDADVLRSLPKLGHADRHRALRRSVNRGLVIQRRGPDGREHVAVASEGWRLLRSRAA